MFFQIHISSAKLVLQELYIIIGMVYVCVVIGFYVIGLGN